MNRTTIRRTAVTAALLTAAAGATALPAQATGTAAPPAAATGSAADTPGSHVAQLRQAIAKYRDVSVALADGFVAPDACVQSPAGGMGLHYINPARLMQPIDGTRPQILLYERAGDGSLRLNGAEFFHADADQDLATDDDRPSLWGQPFDGPMPGHEPGMPIHYDLHVWTDKANPTGVFSPWNPRVSC